MPGARGWFKVRCRETTEAIVGGVTGTLSRPQLLVLGRYGEQGQLRPVGRTTPLKPDTARQLTDTLTAAGSDHPWTEYGSRPHGAAVNPSVRSWSSLSWWPKSARTPRSTEARGDTRCAWSGCVWTPLWPTCLRAYVPTSGEGAQPSSG